MQQRSFGQRIWRLIGPFVVKMGIAFAVEAVVILLYAIFVRPDTFQAAVNQEDLMQKTLVLTDGILKYATEISALSAFCAIPVFVWMFRKDRKLDQENGRVQSRRGSWKSYMFLVGISIATAIGLNNLLLLSNLSQMSEGYQKASELLYQPSIFVQLLCVGIIIPIMEELMFRGLLFQRLKENMPAMRAMIYSALFFGLYHGNLVQMIYGALCGVLLAYVYEKFGSLKAPMIMHVLMNITACIVTEIDGFAWMLEEPVRVGIITVLCAVAASGTFVAIKEIK